jgi:hypothetical protein
MLQNELLIDLVYNVFHKKYPDKLILYHIID